MVLIVAWIIPGAGQGWLGQRGKALAFFLLITGTLVAGWLLGGLTNVTTESLWYFAQLGAAGPTLILTPINKFVASGGLPPQGTVYDIGTLYTAVAGLLNILVMMDAYVRATQKGGEKQE
jgi:hypothetical protein